MKTKWDYFVFIKSTCIALIIYNFYCNFSMGSEWLSHYILYFYDNWEFIRYFFRLFGDLPVCRLYIPSSHLCNIPISYSVLFMFVFPSLHIILPIQTISQYRKTDQFLIIFSHWFKQNLSIFNLLLCWGWHLQLPIFVINVFWINVKYSSVIFIQF